ncbi:hypothetical protein BGW42_001073 [Actinomortierella wolfii]|nr:hypothetical protein BGW42_001073 [Actinomortierella wolfii]KAG0233505.1 hypothetical protein BGW41_001465 [Actinomortierella wolfii]
MASRLFATAFKPTTFATSSSASLLRPTVWVRFNSTVVPAEPPASLNQGEKHLYKKLFERFQPSKLVVQDISGGCGSMYQIEVVSPEFKSLTMVKQHRLVNETLKEEIKTMHGIRLTTKAA